MVWIGRVDGRFKLAKCIRTDGVIPSIRNEVHAGCRFAAFPGSCGVLSLLLKVGSCESMLVGADALIRHLGNG